MRHEDAVFNNILIFDGSNCLHRAIAEPHLWNLSSNGARTGGIYGVLQIICKEFKIYNYYPVVVFDGKLSTRRLGIYPNYKHHSEFNSDETHDSSETSKEYIRQRNILINLLPQIGIPVIRLENWEGDDIIAYLASISANSIVVSEDKDLYQLISSEPFKCSIKHGMKNKIVNYKTLLDENLTPKQFMLNKCFLGDVSDNIPTACPKIGDKYVGALYKLYEYCVMNNMQYPTTDFELEILCKRLNINKRQALLNFQENQFLTNLALVDLTIPVSELTTTLKLHIQDIIRTTVFTDTFLNIDNFVSTLNLFNIKSFYINGLHESLNTTKSSMLYVN